ncbi:S1 RNA-binding domain-containing protein [bacterium]|nr:MAG: S1 RNA-binding domain-containing protein [bacterium]
MIKTVVQKDGKLNKKDNFSFLERGETIEAEVLNKGRKIIYFNLGPYGIGICYKSEFFDMPQDMKEIEEGKVAIAKVLRPENEDGYIELSLKRAGEEKSWEYIDEKMKKEEEIVVRIIGANRGGLLTRVRGVDAFLPASQLSHKHYPEFGGDGDRILKELRKLVSQDLKVKIVDIEKKDKKLILSERADEVQQIKKKIKEYKIGDVVKGKICGIVDYGAFVKFGNSLEGLVHISEIDWQLIEDPRDVLNVGQEIKAKIIGLKDDQVSLSLKALKKDPWKEIDKKYRIGDVVKAKVIRVNPYGAFVKLDEKIQGLVPISKIPKKENKLLLEEGKDYDFKVFSLNALRHRMALVPVATK